MPAAVQQLVDGLLTALRQALPDNLVGLYLRGSLATGGFVPETSDVDLFAVTERPMTGAEYEALQRVHGEVESWPNPHARRLEIAYVDRQALRHFLPGRRHPTLGQGEKLAWTEHRSNWILERWTLREHGVAIYGPEPRTLIDPISAAAVREAVHARLPDWAVWANAQDETELAAPRASSAYWVETMCRALYTLDCGALCPKATAVQWARVWLPEPWRSTVARSQQWRTDRTPDAAVVQEALRFVKWATRLAMGDASSVPGQLGSET